MSETQDAPEVMDDEPEAPQVEILVFGMAGGYLGASINREIDPVGPNIGERNKVRMIMATAPEQLDARIVSTLISEFGLTQEEARIAADNITPLAPAVGVAGDAVPLTGGTMTGPLMLSEDPAGDVPLQAATKHYIDNIDNMKANIHGDTMTGPLVLAPLADPPDPMEAVGKQYVDDAVAALEARVAALEALVPTIP